MDAALPDGENSGWHVDELVSTLVLSDRGIRLVEWWSVVADTTLDELLVELNVDGARQLSAPGTVITVRGGELGPDRWPDSPDGREVIGIRLPRWLGPGDRHDFDLTLGLPPSAQLHRHVHVPTVRCRRLELRVHFAGPIQPRMVSVLEGACVDDPETEARESERPGPPIDRVGDVGVIFQNPRPGLGYGMSWGPPPVEPIRS
jgi:hypothetical protein